MNTFESMTRSAGVCESRACAMPCIRGPDAYVVNAIMFIVNVYFAHAHDGDAGAVSASSAATKSRDELLLAKGKKP